MKTLILAFKNCPKYLTLASIICLSLYLCNVLWWMNLEAWFKIAPKIGEIANTIFSAIITGHIFYAIVNQIKENQDKENIKSIVSKSIEEIYHHNTDLLNKYFEASNYIPKKLPLTSDEVENILKSLESFSSPPKIVYGYPNPINYTWFQVAQTSRQNAKNEINNLMRFSSLLDTELLRLLHEIERADYFRMIDDMSLLGKDFRQFSLFKNSYFEIQNLNIDLIRYAFKVNCLIIPDQNTLNILKKLITIGISEEEIKKMSQNNEA